MESIWKKAHSLQEFIAPSNYKSYDELKAKLVKVLGLDNSTLGMTPAAARAKASVTEAEVDTPWEAPPKLKAAATPKFDEDEDDESLEFFKKLAG